MVAIPAHHSTMVMMVLLPLEICLNHRYEVILTFFKALNECLFRVPGEVIVLYHVIVQVVAEIFSTNVPTVSIEYSEKAYLGPISFPVLIFWLEDIQYNAHTIFIILPNYALISISGICLHDTAFLI